MMVMSENSGKRIGRELVQKPFPGGTGTVRMRLVGLEMSFLRI